MSLILIFFCYGTAYSSPSTENSSTVQLVTLIVYDSPLNHNNDTVNKLESIQRTETRFCCNDFSGVTDMFSPLNLPYYRLEEP